MARLAKQPRHHNLDLTTLLSEKIETDDAECRATLINLTRTSNTRPIVEPDAYAFKEDKKHVAAVEELRKSLQSLKIVARAKVTTNRIYCSAYHPEIKKDLIFFGDKHGQLGIWDARSPVEIEADDDEETSDEQRELGKSHILQAHYPATSKSSVSSIKFDPSNSHSVSLFIHTQGYAHDFCCRFIPAPMTTQSGNLISRLESLANYSCRTRCLSPVSIWILLERICIALTLPGG